MYMTIEERWARIKNTSHVVKIVDFSVYPVTQMWMVDEHVIFVETMKDVWYQDTEVLTLEEAAGATSMINRVKDLICSGK